MTPFVKDRREREATTEELIFSSFKTTLIINTIKSLMNVNVKTGIKIHGNNINKVSFV